MERPNWFRSGLVRLPARKADRGPYISPVTYRRPLLPFVALAVAACAETTAPLPPPVELLLVVNTGTPSLSIVTLSDDETVVSLSLGGPVPADARPVTGRRYAVVATGGGDSLTVIDVVRRAVTREVSAGPAARARGGVILNDSIAFVALSGRNRVLRLNLETGDTASLPAGKTPEDVALVRGRLFVVNANLAPCPAPDLFCPAGNSWVSVLDPATGLPSAPGDSIPLLGPGHASYAAVGSDGKLYVMSVGGPGDRAGRLSIIDPISRAEAGSFGGFGDAPGQIAADRQERIFVSSRTEGLMVFNTRTRTVERGAGKGIPVQTNAGVAVDAANQVYAVESGACGSAPGRARMFRPDLTEIRSIGLGSCAAAATTALIPPEPDGP
jgi:DNA-binding beta-propeller fold protein YncE